MEHLEMKVIIIKIKSQLKAVNSSLSTAEENSMKLDHSNKTYPNETQK